MTGFITREERDEAVSIAKQRWDDPEAIQLAIDISETYEAERGQRQIATRKLFQDRETHGLPQEALQEISRNYAGNQDRKYKVFNDLFFREFGGIDQVTIEAEGSSLRKQYALRTWGEEITDDKAFADRLASDFDFEDSIAERARMAAFLETPPLQALGALESENGGNPVYSGRRNQWIDSFSGQAREIRQRISPYRTTVASVVSQLQGKTGTGQTERERGAAGAKRDPERDDPGSYRDLAEILMGVPKEDRDFVISAIIARGTNGDAAARKFYAQKLAENFGRGVMDYVHNIPAIADRGQALLVRDRIAEGFEVPSENTGTAEGYLRAVTEGVVGGSAYKEARILTGAMGKDWSGPGEDVQAEAAEMAERMVEAVDLRQRLRFIAENDIDPATSENVAARGFLQAARSIPYTLASIAPGGFALNSAMMAETSYQTLRQHNPEMTARQAQAIAGFSGPLQAVVERVSGRVLTGRLPAFQRFANQAVVTQGAAARRFGARLGAATGIEMVQENVQDITPYFVQGAFSALSQDVPEVPWEDVFGDMARNQTELFFAVLPLALIGAGAGTVNDFRGARDMIGNHDLLKGSGVSEAAASDIRAAAIAGDFDRAQALLRQAHLEGGQDQKGMRENIADAIPAMIENRERVREMVNKARELDIMPGITKMEGGTWALEFNDGSGMSFDSYEAATERMFLVAKEEIGSLHEQTVSTIRQVSRDIEEGRGLKYLFSMDAPTVADNVAEGIISQEEAAESLEVAETVHGGLQSEFDEAVVTSQIIGGSFEDAAASARILGSSVNEFRDGILWTTMRLFDGHTFLTVIEEKTEGDAKLMIQEPGLRKWMVSAIRDWEGRSGDRLLRSPNDEEITNRNLVEAWSAMSQSFLIGSEGPDGDHLSAVRKMLESAAGPSMAAYANLFRSVLNRAAMIEKARAEGTFDGDLEEFLAKSVGMSEQRIFEREVAKEGAGIADQISPELSDNASSRESVGENGKTFSVLPGVESVQEVAFDDILWEKEIPGDDSVLPELLALAERFGIQRPFDTANILERWVEVGIEKDQGATPDDARIARNLVDRGRGRIERPDEVDDFFYHVTTKKRAKEIFKSGEIKPGQPAQFSTAATQANSGGRVFVSDLGGVSFWRDRIQEQLDDRGSREKLTVLRIPKSFVKNPQVDDAMEKRSDSFYTESAIPVSAESGTTFSILPAQDAEYLDLAKDPEANREKLQAMVDDAIRDSGNFSQEVYHGTESNFNVFRLSKEGAEEGVFFSSSKEEAGSFVDGSFGQASRVVSAVISGNLKRVDVDGELYDPDMMSDIMRQARQEGFDGVVVENIQNFEGGELSDTYVAFNRNQIKSTDPVTYDENGKVIPLSQRFDSSRDEITFSILPGGIDLDNEFARMFSPFHRSPVLRAKLGQEMQRRVAGERRKLDEVLRAKRTLANIKREADFREGLEYDRLLREVFGADTQAKQEALPAVDRQAARSDAKSIADKWRAEQERKLAEVPRATLIAFMRTLDAIHRALPAEVRGRIGGFVALAKLKGPGAMLNEIERRINKVDVELEKWMRDEAEKRRRKLWKKAQPKRESGKKPKGKLGADIHDLFDTLNDALLWDGDEAEAHASMLEAKIAGGELTAEQEAHAQIEANLVRLFSDWGDTREDTGRRNAKGRRITRTVRKGADAARRIAAIEAAEEVWKKGYMAERARAAKERERRQAIRQGIRKDTGKLGNRAQRIAKAKRDAGFFGKLKDSVLPLLNFEQTVGFALGDGSMWGRQIVNQQREAEYQKIDEVQAVLDGIESLFTKLGGSKLKGEQLFHRLSQPSFETAQGGMMSEMEGLTALMFWRQEDGKRHMRGKRDDAGNVTSTWSYDQSFIDEIEGNLSKEAFAVLDYLTDQFAGEWETLNPIFRELNGINLPRHANYSPIKVKPQQAQGGQMVDPVTGTTMGTGSRTPGSLRTRAQVVAEPDFVNAVELFIAHKKEIAHWKAFAKFNTEVQAILGNREVSNSIAAKGGEEAMSQLRSWMDYFAQGGVRDAGAHFATNKLINRVIGRGAAMALVGRAGTLAIQSTQLGAAAAKMPLGSYMLRLSKLLTGNMEWGEAMRSGYIQRRLKQMPPHVRIAMDGLNASNPTKLKHAVRKLGETLPGADALFTAGTFAMVLDFQYSQLVKAGVDPATAREMATKEAERITDEIAQPTREGARSMMELTNKNPMGRMAWAFSSEARKNLALVAYSAMNRPAVETARALLYTVAINGIMAAIIRTAWRDARDDEDDEWFDEKHWSLPRMALAVATEPLYGFPALGELAQDAIYAAAGEWKPSGTIIDAPVRAPGAIADILTGEGDSRDVETILMTIGLGSESAAAAASLMHIYRDAEGLIENLTN